MLRAAVSCVALSVVTWAACRGDFARLQVLDIEGDAIPEGKHQNGRTDKSRTSVSLEDAFISYLEKAAEPGEKKSP